MSVWYFYILEVSDPVNGLLLITELSVQVIGNKWDQYLDLLQAEYSEGCVRTSFPVCSLLLHLHPHG